mmetsp:Transcript_371/g.2889  ORF Transcript_371/g.2889 Transcript_371/m.2889 type:complete len:236 (+) Transcript_371:4228-4935(+)
MNIRSARSKDSSFTSNNLMKAFSTSTLNSSGSPKYSPRIVLSNPGVCLRKAPTEEAVRGLGRSCTDCRYSNPFDGSRLKCSTPTANPSFSFFFFLISSRLTSFPTESCRSTKSGIPPFSNGRLAEPAVGLDGWLGGLVPDVCSALSCIPAIITNNPSNDKRWTGPKIEFTGNVERDNSPTSDSKALGWVSSQSYIRYTSRTKSVCRQKSTIASTATSCMSREKAAAFPSAIGNNT